MKMSLKCGVVVIKYSFIRCQWIRQERFMIKNKLTILI